MAREVSKKPRLNIYLDDEETRRQVRVAAAKRDLSITEYCAKAIEEHLVKDNERAGSAATANKGRQLLAGMACHRKCGGRRNV